MISRYILIFAGTMFVALSLCARTDDTSGLRFSHGDWELVCDNTRTCRAAGYQSDRDDRAVSVLLTRKAGPRQPVTAKLMLGQPDMIGEPDADEALGKLIAGVRLSMYIDDQAVKQIETRRGSLTTYLSAEQAAVLLAALLRDRTIEWVAGDDRWRLSGKGVTAVLLKMDDFQGRVDTPGALVRKGTRDEDEVLPPLPVPIVIAAAVPEAPASDNPLAATEARDLREALRATIQDDDYCPYLTEETELSYITEVDLEVTAHRLSETALLVSTKCWTGAYNEGFGYWVVEETSLYRPVLVTTSGSDYQKGAIWASHKDRGAGDCWSSDQWAWDGTRFVHTSSFSKGLCKWLAPGGAWVLPTIVTDVRQAGDELATMEQHHSLAPTQEHRVLECETAFPPTMTAANLAEHFSAENITNTDIPVGEGFYEPGTILFSESEENKVEILWQDTERLAIPRLVRIRGERSTWRTAHGLSLGDDLLSIERLNGRPFQLTGFEWDYAGTQLSWSGGFLERGVPARCGVRVRLRPEDPEEQMQWYMQVLGDSEYASKHPAMQALNPRVYELWLEYP